MKSTYKLEGGGVLIFCAYGEISKLQAVIHSAYYPNVNAGTKKSSGNATQQQQLNYHAKSCVQPGYQYFERKFGTDLKVVVSTFKCARYFDPSKINELNTYRTEVINQTIQRRRECAT